MAEGHLVVDGSNIATEGRSHPSLEQLLDAVQSVSKEFSFDNVTVIVDATFGHRIDSSERAAYDEKVDKGEIITPPAGVIGRGDAFILEVADRADAVVLSNDSFQEFHGTYPWLFDDGRLLGGKHVPGVGWIFLARSPVRGPTSRRAVSDAKRKRRGSKTTAKAKPSSKRPASKKPSKRAARKDVKAEAAEEKKQDSGRKRGGKEPEPYNEPLPFIEFVGAHPVGSVVEAEVEQFSSHGAYVVCDGTRCYISLKSMSDPPPRSARELLTIGETREFVVQAIDTPRRGIDLALPGMEAITEEDLVEEGAAAEAAPEAEEPEPTREEVPPEPVDERKLSVSERRRLRARRQEEAAPAADEQEEQSVTTSRGPARKRPSKKRPSKKAAAKKAAAKKAASTKRATKKAAAKKGTAKRAPAKKGGAKKAGTKRAAARKGGAKKGGAKKAASTKRATKKTAAKRAPAKKKSSAKKAAGKKRAPRKSAAKKRSRGS